MKRYTRRVTEDGESFECEGMHIPKDTRNRHYRQMLSEVEEGEAEIEDFVEPTPEPEPESDDDIVQLTRKERRQLRKLAQQANI